MFIKNVTIYKFYELYIFTTIYLFITVLNNVIIIVGVRT